MRFCSRIVDSPRNRSRLVPRPLVARRFGDQADDPRRAPHNSRTRPPGDGNVGSGDANDRASSFRECRALFAKPGRSGGAHTRAIWGVFSQSIRHSMLTQRLELELLMPDHAEALFHGLSDKPTIRKTRHPEVSGRCGNLAELGRAHAPTARIYWLCSSHHKKEWLGRNCLRTLSRVLGTGLRQRVRYGDAPGTQ